MFLKKINRKLSKIRNRHFLILDVLIMLVTPFISLLVRLDGKINFSAYLNGLIYVTLIFLLFKIIIFIRLGLYKREWKNASIDEMGRLIYIVLFTVFFQSVLFFIFHSTNLFYFNTMPLSLPFLDGIFTFIFIATSRFILRLAERVDERRITKGNGERILVVGAGKAGISIVQEMQRNPQLGMIPVAFIDDNIEKKGFKIRGLPVAGIRKNIPEITRKMKINKVIIAMPVASGDDIRDIVSICNKAGIRTRTIPGIYELLDENVRIDNLREVRIEDLLRRKPVKTDIQKVESFIKGKTILVTGSGGSIGSELCRQIIKAKPKKLLLLGHGENSVFEIHHEIEKRLSLSNGKFLKTELSTLIADVRNASRIEKIISENKPDIIFHAAAHKHVPIMEVNSTEAVTNNVLGTKILLEAALRNNVENFIFISTDKAVNPSSIMGASKRIAEMLVLNAARDHNKYYSAVRFGNVLGSRGSAVLTFKKQISEGGPVTITNPDIVRYFMTIPEAVQLVLQASVLGSGGEVFVLDMGQPIKVLDLAKDVIRLSGYEVDKDIKIIYTGLRPGEKLYEELFVAGEDYQKTLHEKILIAKNSSKFIPEFFNENLHILLDSVNTKDKEFIVTMLKRLVPEYMPDERVIESTEIMI